VTRTGRRPASVASPQARGGTPNSVVDSVCASLARRGRRRPSAAERLRPRPGLTVTLAAARVSDSEPWHVCPGVRRTADSSVARDERRADDEGRTCGGLGAWCREGRGGDEAVGGAVGAQFLQTLRVRRPLESPARTEAALRSVSGARTPARALW
jgi:hypothetical protein